MTSQIFLFCGSGGVGKTTLSAAFALHQASLGKRTLVLTVDPAKRLGTALGIDQLEGKAKPVKISGSGSLDAMMLNSKHSFDQLVERYAPTQESKDRILSNSLYKHLSEMLAGSQDYMAMETLFDLDQSGKYDVIVVDTPPMQNAVDFLEAPQKMKGIIGNSILQLFLKPAMLFGKKGLSLFEKGSRQALKVLEKLTGASFLQDLGEMVVAFQELLDGFEERAAAIEERLKSQKTKFFLVSSTRSQSVFETKMFSRYLKEKSYHLGGLLLNRFLGDYNKTSPRDTDPVLKETLALYKPLIEHDRQILKTLQAIDAPIRTLPYLQNDIHELKDLLVLSDHFKRSSQAS